jgi:hypothetical protein
MLEREFAGWVRFVGESDLVRVVAEEHFAAADRRASRRYQETGDRAASRQADLQVRRRIVHEDLQLPRCMPGCTGGHREAAARDAFEHERPILLRRFHPLPHSGLRRLLSKAKPRCANACA